MSQRPRKRQRHVPGAVTTTSTPPPDMPVQRPAWLAMICLVLLVVSVFHRSLLADFVNLDDNSNLAKNPAMHELSLAWQKPYLDAYLPVVYTAWHGLSAIARQTPDQGNTIESWSPIPELSATPFHAANLLFHGVNTVLLLLVLQSLFPQQSPWQLAAVTALFAVHPLQVEAVAWVTALKDILSGTFSLWLILLFVRQPPSALSSLRHITLLSVIFMLACLSKSTRVFLPIWLVWLGHLHWRMPWPSLAWRLWPLFVLACFISLLAMIFQPDPKVMAFQEVWRRPLVAADALLFYAGKLVWPATLAVDYGRNPQFLFESGQVYVSCAIAMLAGMALWYWRQRLDRWILLGLSGFVLSLLPLLGLKPFVFQTISTVSDRYCYLSLALLTCGLAPWLCQMPRRTTIVMLCSLIAACALRSWQQLPAWQSSATLWRHTLTVTPDSGIAHNNLASIHEALGENAAAIYHYEQSTIRLPLAQTYARIAILYSDQQDWQKASEWNEKGLTLEPDNALMLNNRAVFQARLQRRGFRLAK